MDDAITHIENAEFSALPVWMQRGACVGEDPELWYPERGRSSEPAKRICARCPVRDECLAWALENEDYGIWGGLSSKERKPLRKARAGTRLPSPQLGGSS